MTVAVLDLGYAGTLFSAYLNVTVLVLFMLLVEPAKEFRESCAWYLKVEGMDIYGPQLNGKGRARFLGVPKM